MKLFKMAFLAVAIVPILAQSQEGAVAIAGAIKVGDTSADFTKCVVALKATGTKDADAIKACTKASEIASKTVTRLANEAADATKASRPIFVESYGGYGYGGGYYGRTWRPLFRWQSRR